MLGEALRAARRAAGWSQEELAEQAGISRNYVSLLERDERSPTVAVLIDVCRALGVSAADVVRQIEQGTGGARRRRRRRAPAR